MSFRIVGNCPVNATLAPYIEIIRRETDCAINSIYRGADAEAILHRHGKHSQAELYATLPAGVANPPGRSTHELRSDGVAYPGPIGRKLDWWQEGFDVNDSDVHRVIAAARKYGWVLRQPYNSGVEFHHLNFAKKPRPRTLKTLRKIVKIRRELPTR